MPVVTPLLADDPTDLGEYHLSGKLGGSSSTVYLGTGPSGERVAIRLFPAEVDRERFEREIAPLRDLSPFCTAQIIGTGEADGRPYLVSEYVDGPTLRERVEADGALEASELHRLAVNTMTALVAIHQAGVAHLDLRPDNVVLGEGGARVLGFGVARALETTDSGTTRAVAGPAFVAPEQLQAEDVGAPADVFAWAATIAYAATGRSVFDAGSMSGTVNRILSGEPDLSGVDPVLLPLLRSCLAKDPADRPAASDALLRLVGERSLVTTPGPPPSPPEPQAAPARRAGRVAALVAGALAIALVSGGGVYLLTGQRGGESAGASRAAASQAASPSGSALVTPAPVVTASITSAPYQKVPEKPLTEVKLGGTEVVLREHAMDPVKVRAYLQWTSPYTTYVREKDGTGFRSVGQGLAPAVSPDGTWVALSPLVKFLDSDHDSVRFLNLVDGTEFTVTTVKQPLETGSPVWSRDGTKLLLSMWAPGEKKKDPKRIIGFVHIDLVTRQATAVETEYIGSAHYPFTLTPWGVPARAYSDELDGLEIYDLSGRVTRRLRWVGLPINTTVYSPSGERFLTRCPKDTTLMCVWHTGTGNRLATIKTGKGDGLVFGWFNDNHVVVAEKIKKGKLREIRVVNFVGDTVRVLGRMPDGAALFDFGPTVTR